MKIKAILSDADGTLITKGRLTNFPTQLPHEIRQIRRNGILFNLASGRPYFEQVILHEHLNIQNPDPKEAILYEGSGVKFFDGSEAYNLGGLSKPFCARIDQFLAHHKLVEGMVPQPNNDRYESQTGYVTPSFISEGTTDNELLGLRYQAVKQAVESEFEGVEVAKSADAIDIFAVGVTKAAATRKYSEVTGIPLSEIAAFGDSGNDMPMFKEVGEAGGLCVYVGTDMDQMAVIVGYEHHLVYMNQGPQGTMKGFGRILKL
jgi:5-amino-6-(5-phospho-D-ribitylamino)uracil phosphatase